MPRCPNPRCRTDYPPDTFECINPFCLCLLPGAIVGGRYRVETLLGLGGMGAVYRVSDTFEMQQVALKVISTQYSDLDTATAIERFRREARFAHQLYHKNIVPVLNFGQDGKLLFLVMPLVTGGTLKSLLKGEQPLPLTVTQRYLNELADAIDAIHAHPQQIVHRDIKPSNLLIHQDDKRIVVADFGIARAMSKEKPLTKMGWAVGTEHYIAPEQSQGSAEPASDIYSMGVLAYQMLTGLLPFQAIVRSRAAELPTPSELNTALPPAVDAVIQRATEVDPKKRYPSGRAFADALNAALQAVLHDADAAPTLALPSNANIIVRTLIPEHPCSTCGQENRNTSRFCRRCGHRLDETAPMVTDGCLIGYVSDTGRRYAAQENEDMLLLVQGLSANLAPPPRPFGLFAVADGLRGPQGKSVAGHEASRLAIETVADVVLPLIATPLPSHTTPGSSFSSVPGISMPGRTHPGAFPPDSIVEQWLREGVRRANQVIHHCNDDYDTTMASTLTVALLHKRQVYVVSVGDSRAYHYNAKTGLRLITTDHTLAANLVDAKLLTSEELYSSEKRKQLYRYLGQYGSIPIDFFQFTVETDDLILLCTNGLWHMVHDKRLAELAAQDDDPQKLARTLVDQANLAGGKGNVSVIVVKIL